MRFTFVAAAAVLTLVNARAESGNPCAAAPAASALTQADCADRSAWHERLQQLNAEHQRYLDDHDPVMIEKRRKAEEAKRQEAARQEEEAEQRRRQQADLDAQRAAASRHVSDDEAIKQLSDDHDERVRLRVAPLTPDEIELSLKRAHGCVVDGEAEMARERAIGARSGFVDARKLYQLGQLTNNCAEQEKVLLRCKATHSCTGSAYMGDRFWDRKQAAKK